MSYGAGSVGLNLQFCELRVSVRPLVEPGRRRPGHQPRPSHRRGTGPVTVTRFLTLDTIEERIDQMLEEKRELFDTIFSGRRGAPPTRPDAAGNLRALQAPLARPGRFGWPRRDTEYRNRNISCGTTFLPSSALNARRGSTKLSFGHAPRPLSTRYKPSRHFVPIVVACPSCSKSLRTEKLAGKPHCPACKQPVKIPPPVAVAEESDDFEYRLAPLPDSKPIEALRRLTCRWLLISLFRELKRTASRNNLRRCWQRRQ